MAQFPSTQWSLIRLSGDSSSARRAAFGELAGNYRAAIHAYFRGRLGVQAADDATQAFLADSFEHAWWAKADAGLGSFRTFLLMLMARRVALLRSASRPECASLDAADAVIDESRNAEGRFDAQFALVLTARAIEALRVEYAARGRGGLFASLLPLVSDPPPHGGIGVAARALALAPNTLSVELGRLRARLRERVHTELRELCADDTAFRADRAALHDAMGSGA